MRILFVCTGNICRSPLAEGLLSHALAGRGLSAHAVDSAGTQARVGLAPEAGSLRAATRRDIDISQLRSRPVVTADFFEHELIVAMDYGHLDWLQAIAPSGSTAAITLMQDASGQPIEVVDPYGRRQRAFDNAAHRIEQGLPALLKRLA